MSSSTSQSSKVIISRTLICLPKELLNIIYQYSEIVVDLSLMNTLSNLIDYDHDVSGNKYVESSLRSDRYLFRLRKNKLDECSIKWPSDGPIYYIATHPIIIGDFDYLIFKWSHGEHTKFVINEVDITNCRRNYLSMGDLVTTLRILSIRVKASQDSSTSENPYFIPYRYGIQSITSIKFVEYQLVDRTIIMTINILQS